MQSVNLWRQYCFAETSVYVTVLVVFGYTNSFLWRQNHSCDILLNDSRLFKVGHGYICQPQYLNHTHSFWSCIEFIFGHVWLLKCNYGQLESNSVCQDRPCEADRMDRLIHHRLCQKLALFYLMLNYAVGQFHNARIRDYSRKASQLDHVFNIGQQ